MISRRSFIMAAASTVLLPYRFLADSVKVKVPIEVAFVQTSLDGVISSYELEAVIPKLLEIDECVTNSCKRIIPDVNQSSVDIVLDGFREVQKGIKVSFRLGVRDYWLFAGPDGHKKYDLVVTKKGKIRILRRY